jgi:hypothetical protein
MPAIHDIRLADTLTGDSLKDTPAEKNEYNLSEFEFTGGTTPDIHNSKSADPADDGKNIMSSEKSGHEVQLGDQQEAASTPINMHPIYDLRSSYVVSGNYQGNDVSEDGKHKAVGSIFPFYDPKSPEQVLGYCMYDPSSELEKTTLVDNSQHDDSTGEGEHKVLERRGWKSFFRSINPLNCFGIDAWDKTGRTISAMPEAWPNEPPYPPHPPHYHSSVQVLDNRYIWDPPHEPQLPVMEPRPAFWEPLDVGLRTPPNEWDRPIPPAGPYAYLYPGDVPIQMGPGWYPALYSGWDTSSDSGSASGSASTSNSAPFRPNTIDVYDTTPPPRPQRVQYPGIMDYEEWLTSTVPFPMDPSWVGENWYNAHSIPDLPTIPRPDVTLFHPSSAGENADGRFDSGFFEAPALRDVSLPQVDASPLRLSNGGRPYDPGNFEIPEVIVTPPTPPPCTDGCRPFRIHPSLWDDSNHDPPIITKRDSELDVPMIINRDSAPTDIGIQVMILPGKDAEISNFTLTSPSASGVSPVQASNGLLMFGAVVACLLFGRR